MWVGLRSLCILHFFVAYLIAYVRMGQLLCSHSKFKACCSPSHQVCILLLTAVREMQPTAPTADVGSQRKIKATSTLSLLAAFLSPAGRVKLLRGSGATAEDTKQCYQELWQQHYCDPLILSADFMLILCMAIPICTHRLRTQQLLQGAMGKLSLITYPCRCWGRVGICFVCCNV